MRLEPLPANQLARMPPSMVGGGERAAAGLPHQGAHLNRALKDQVKIGVPNALTGAPPSSVNMLALAGRPQPQVNALTGMPTLPAPPPSVPQLPLQPSPTPAQVPSAPPQQGVTAAPAPQGPAGQDMANQVAVQLAPNKMTDADLTARTDRTVFLQNALRAMLQSKTLDHGDVAHVLADAMKNGKVPASEAPEILGSLPTDPTKLRAEMERRHQIGIHMAVQLAGEQQRRAALRGEA